MFAGLAYIPVFDENSGDLCISCHRPLREGDGYTRDLWTDKGYHLGDCSLWAVRLRATHPLFRRLAGI